MRDQAAGDRLALALGDEQQPVLRHVARHAAEELAREVGRVAVLVGRCARSSGRRSPSRPRRCRRRARSGSVTPASATLRRSWRIFLRLSCARLARKASKSAPARVHPVELHGVAQHQAGCRAGGDVLVAGEQQVQRRQLLLLAPAPARPRPARAAHAASRASRRGPGTGVNGTATSALG